MGEFPSDYIFGAVGEVVEAVEAVEEPAVSGPRGESNPAGRRRESIIEQGGRRWSSTGM
jgi:hypothetical protein